MKEEWKVIDGHSGYMVSNYGNIKSLSFNKTGIEKILTPCVDRKGYFFVSLHGKQLRVHRLVALAFIPKEEGKHLINHKDEDKQNNAVWNLEWCSPSYNLNYNGNREKIAKKHRKKVYAFKDGILVESFDSITQAANAFGVSLNNISSCLHGRKKKACGLEWSFELNKEYYEKACKRIKEEKRQLTLF